MKRKKNYKKIFIKHENYIVLCEMDVISLVEIIRERNKQYTPDKQEKKKRMYGLIEKKSINKTPQQYTVRHMKKITANLWLHNERYQSLMKRKSMLMKTIIVEISINPQFNKLMNIFFFIFLIQFFFSVRTSNKNEAKP